MKSKPVVYQGDSAVELPGVGVVNPGQKIEVPEDLAASLLRQSAKWKASKPSKSSTKSSEEE